MIESYSFGKITIDGAAYDSDLIILPGKVIKGWRRISGHVVRVEDLSSLLDNPPEILVIGCGFTGRMKPHEDLLSYATRHGIKLEFLRTKEACAALNSAFEEGKDAAGAFHLTC